MGNRVIKYLPSKRWCLLSKINTYHPKIFAQANLPPRYCASHARVISGITQVNLTHLSTKMTTPHQSGAPFVGERAFQNLGVCGQAFLLSPHHPLLRRTIALAPIYARSGCGKTLCTGTLTSQATVNRTSIAIATPRNKTSKHRV